MRLILFMIRNNYKPGNRELEAWAKQPGIIENLREARPTLPDAVSDRQQDICEPLFAIAEMAGGDWSLCVLPCKR